MPSPLKIIIYPIFALMTLVLFSFLLFPFDSVKVWLARELEAGLGGGYQMTIGTVGPSLLSGITLRDVEIRPRGVSPLPLSLPLSTIAPLKVSKARLKFALLPLLSGTTEVSFDLRSGDGRGKATGFYSLKKGGFALKMKLDHTDASILPLLIQKSGIALSGTLGGTVQIDVFSEDALKNSGKVSLDLLDLRLGEVTLGEGEGAIRIPQIQLTQAGGLPSKVDLTIDRGNVEIKQVNLAGGDLDLQMDGKVYGARQFENYRFNLKGALKVSAALADKVPLLLMVEKQKSPDGSYPFTITGRVSGPSIRIGEFKVPL